MSRYCYIVLLLFLVALWGSCRKDFEYAPSSGKLQFSKDTVFLDTVFSNIGSSTYGLKVYNKTGEDLEIPTIRLGGGQNSSYRLNVDGVAGKEFNNVPIFARDSLFVFVETTFDISPTNEPSFLYTDAIQFDSGANLQEVHLVTLVKDAIFLFPPTNPDGTKQTLVLGFDAEGNEIRVEGFELAADQLNFTAEKPYVIYGYAAVPENGTLAMDPGTRVHFHNNSGIWVQPGASLQVNGALSEDSLLLEKEVVFEGDRLEPEFGAVPGQWGTIWLSSGSTDNHIDHLSLKNATIGLLVEGNTTLSAPRTLTIRNSRIYNSAQVNLWAKTASISADNLVLGNAGNTSLYCNLGGNYLFRHSTIANYWSSSFRSGPALQIDNETTLPSGETLKGDLTDARFINCIIDGNSLLELALDSNGTNAFEFSFTHCSIQFKDGSGRFSGNALYDFTDSDRYDQVLLSPVTGFRDPVKNNFLLGEGSMVKGQARPETAQLVPLDILGIDRRVEPDMGAYQSTSNK